MQGNNLRIVNNIPQLSPNPNLKPYNIVTNDDDTAEITMYGEVVETVPTDWWTGEPIDGLYIVLQDFLDDLGDLKDKSAVTVRINSVGGDLEAGVAIYNRLKELNNVTTIVDGLAASAASLILQAGSTRQVYASSQVMAHQASALVVGYYNKTQLGEISDMLEAANNQVISIYEETTGQSRLQLKHMVEKTTWMTGNEIIENGFADEVIGGKTVTMSMSADRSLFYCNGIPMNSHKLASIPNGVSIANTKSQTAQADANKNKSSKGGNSNMTVDELKQQYPDLVQQIEDNARNSVDNTEITNAATQAERQRIQEIESIENSIADKDLINEAKFGENPMNAKDLAFTAMQKQAQIGNNFLGAMSNDTHSSGVEDVTAVPAGDESSKETKDQADIMAAINAVNGSKGGK